MPICRVDLCECLLALVSAEVGFVPECGWATESHLACSEMSPFSSCSRKSPFFGFEMDSSTPFHNLDSIYYIVHGYITIVLLSFWLGLLGLREHRCFWVLWKRFQSESDKTLGVSLFGCCNWCSFLLMLCLFGKLPERVIDCRRFLSAASTWQSTGPEETVLFWVMMGLFRRCTNIALWTPRKDREPLFMMQHCVGYVQMEYGHLHIRNTVQSRLPWPISEDVELKSGGKLSLVELTFEECQFSIFV